MEKERIFSKINFSKILPRYKVHSIWTTRRCGEGFRPLGKILGRITDDASNQILIASSFSVNLKSSDTRNLFLNSKAGYGRTHNRNRVKFVKKMDALPAGVII